MSLFACYLSNNGTSFLSCFEILDTCFSKSTLSLIFPSYKLILIGLTVFLLGKHFCHFVNTLYEYFKKSGFKCKFFITDVPPEFQKFGDEIHYNQRLSYLEILNYVMQSKGVLEVAQGGNYGLTLRYLKRLFTIIHYRQRHFQR